MPCIISCVCGRAVVGRTTCQQLTCVFHSLTIFQVYAVDASDIAVQVRCSSSIVEIIDVHLDFRSLR